MRVSVEGPSAAVPAGSPGTHLPCPRASTLLPGLSSEKGTHPQPHLVWLSEVHADLQGLVNGYRTHLHQLDDTGGVEWWLSSKELKEDAPEGPEVRGVVIGVLLHQLWGHVQWRSFDRCQHQRLHTQSTCKPRRGGTFNSRSQLQFIKF